VGTNVAARPDDEASVTRTTNIHGKAKFGSLRVQAAKVFKPAEEFLGPMRQNLLRQEADV
jgi:hypothetical protein